MVQFSYLARTKLISGITVPLLFQIIIGLLAFGAPSAMGLQKFSSQRNSVTGFSSRLGGVGRNAVLETASRHAPGTALFLFGSECRLLNSAATLEIQADTNTPKSVTGGAHATLAHPGGQKRYAIYLSLSLVLLVATAVTLLYDIRRKSRSGKRQDPNSTEV